MFKTVYRSIAVIFAVIAVSSASPIERVDLHEKPGYLHHRRQLRNQTDPNSICQVLDSNNEDVRLTPVERVSQKWLTYVTGRCRSLGE